MFDIRVYSKTAFSKKKTKSIFTLRGKERTKYSLQCFLILYILYYNLLYKDFVVEFRIYVTRIY